MHLWWIKHLTSENYYSIPLTKDSHSVRKDNDKKVCSGLKKDTDGRKIYSVDNACRYLSSLLRHRIDLNTSKGGWCAVTKTCQEFQEWFRENGIEKLRSGDGFENRFEAELLQGRIGESV